MAACVLSVDKYLFIYYRVQGDVNFYLSFIFGLLVLLDHEALATLAVVRNLFNEAVVTSMKSFIFYLDGILTTNESVNQDVVILARISSSLFGALQCRYLNAPQDDDIAPPTAIPTSSQIDMDLNRSSLLNQWLRTQLFAGGPRRGPPSPSHNVISDSYEKLNAVMAKHVRHEKFEASTIKSVRDRLANSEDLLKMFRCVCIHVTGLVGEAMQLVEDGPESNTAVPSRSLISLWEEGRMLRLWLKAQDEMNFNDVKNAIER